MYRSRRRNCLLDWGFTKSDVTYDVVHVWNGAFFRLEDHLNRFFNSMAGLRMSIPHDRSEMVEILSQCVRLTGLRDSYVAMVTTRGVPLPGMPRKPSLVPNRFFAYAIPWIDIVPPEIKERGVHLIIATPPRIDPASVDPKIKNYQWGDLTQGLFEAEEKGADVCMLLDAEGYLTEGPGFNVFAVKDGAVVTPDRGVLEGITRLAVIDLCKQNGIPIREGRLTAAELYDADEVFLSSTAGGVIPATRVDDTIYANDSPGPMSLRLKEAYWQAHADAALATPIDYGG